jgi:hypothetical protein
MSILSIRWSVLVIACSRIAVGAWQPEIHFHFNKDEDRAALATFERDDLMPYHESENWKKDMKRLGLPAENTATFDDLDKVMKLNTSYASISNAIGLYYTERNLRQLFHDNNIHGAYIHALGGNPWRQTLGDLKLFEAFHDKGILQERLVELDLTDVLLVRSTYQILADMRNLRKLAMPSRSACLNDDELIFPTSIEELVIHNARIDAKLGRKFKELKKLKKLTLVSCYFDLPKMPDSFGYLKPIKTRTGLPDEEWESLPEYDPLGYVRPHVEELVLLKGTNGAVPLNYVWDKLSSITTDCWIPLDYFWFDAPNMTEPSCPNLKKADIHLDEATRAQAMDRVLRWIQYRSRKNFPIITVK